jgi:rod shape-determining protein MreC
VLGTDRRLRVRLAADFERLEFLRVLRTRADERIETTGGLIHPPARPVQGPPAPSPADIARGG